MGLALPGIYLQVRVATFSNINKGIFIAFVHNKVILMIQSYYSCTAREYTSPAFANRCFTGCLFNYFPSKATVWNNIAHCDWTNQQTWKKEVLLDKNIGKLM